MPTMMVSYFIWSGVFNLFTLLLLRHLPLAPLASVTRDLFQMLPKVFNSVLMKLIFVAEKKNCWSFWDEAFQSQSLETQEDCGPKKSALLIIKPMWAECAFFKWAITGLFFIYFRLFYKQLTHLNSKIVANVGIWSADLWCWRRPLCQLRHNHGSNNLIILT